MKALLAVVVAYISETVTCTFLAAGDWIAAMTTFGVGVAAVIYIKVANIGAGKI